MKVFTREPTKTVLANDITISYDELGQGDLPILFLHGFPFNKSTWEGQMQALKSSHRVIAIDIRSFGASTHNDSELSMNLFADDLIQFMYKLHIPKAILCGLSMGGFIALNAISRYPTLFAGLILCDTQCSADTKEEGTKRSERIQQMEKEGLDEFTEDFIDHIFHPKSLIEQKNQVQKIDDIIRSNSNPVLMNGLKALGSRPETCTTLVSIKVPTLIICGREDQITPLPQSEWMHKNIKNSTLKIIEQAGHLSNIEHPEEFNGYLQQFLLSIPPSL